MELYHFSEDPGIVVFEPRTPAHRPEVEPLVWAVDHAHQWTYLFPRDCPRILAWPLATTTPEDREHWLSDVEARGVACIEWDWLRALRSTRLFRYQLPTEGFVPLPEEDEAWMFVSRLPTTPLACEPVGDLLEALRLERIELRLMPSLVPLRGAWQTTMHISGNTAAQCAGLGGVEGASLLVISCASMARGWRRMAVLGGGIFVLAAAWVGLAALPGGGSPAAVGPYRSFAPLSAHDGPAVVQPTHRVKPGETAYSLALRYGVTAAAVVAENQLTNPNRLQPGSILVLPANASARPVPPGPAAQTFEIGNRSRRVVAISFDAGSDVGYTAQILDTLATHGVKASFGITGAWANANPALMRRIVDEGHHLINHTYSHPRMTTMGQTQRWQELDRTEEAVLNLTGVSTKPFFRPPFGADGGSVLNDVFARGYLYNLRWTVDSLGWNGLSRAAIVSRCLSRAEPGAIYLFHVGSASQDGPALVELINGFWNMGYGIGTVTDVLVP